MGMEREWDQSNRDKFVYIFFQKVILKKCALIASEYVILISIKR